MGALCAAVVLLAAAPPPDSPVADAAMRGDIEAVRALLVQGADVNTAQGDGMTALHWAGENGDVELARLLVHAGANLEAATRVGSYTPLHLASMGGNAAVVSALLDAGSATNARTTTGGATPLHLAAASGSAAAVTALLEHGAAIDARESAWGRTPLMFAAAYDRVQVLSALLERGADPALACAVVNVPAQAEAAEVAERLRNERLEKLQALEAQATGRTGTQEEESGRENRAEAQEEESQEESEAREESEEEEEEEEGPRPLSYPELIGNKGGLTPLLFAVRQGHVSSVRRLLETGADINQTSEGDHTSPLLMATINGHFDLALELLKRGADPDLASDAGATPLYATINLQWAPKSFYPQPTAYKQQQITYLDMMQALLEAGADPNARLTKHLWYMAYNIDQLGVNTKGATPFWRAAYGTDVQAMKLLLAHGADPNIPTQKPPQRRRRDGEEEPDLSGLPPVPVGGPGVYPIHAASGVGYGEGRAGNSHRHVPEGWLPAVKYLIEEIGVDVNARDFNGYNAVHHAAARGDNELILYLVEQGADVTAVSREGQTTVDLANGPVQRISPFPDTIELLESLGAINNHNCQSC